MFRFSIEDKKLLVNYTPYGGVEEILDKIKDNGSCLVRMTFNITQNSLIKSEDDSDEIQFILGVVDGGNYIKLDKDILNVDYNIFIDADIRLDQKLFIAYRNISILAHLVDVIKADIYIDNDKHYRESPNHIALSVYKMVIENFPNSTELTKYANCRISLLLNEYFDGMSKYKINYESYVAKKQLSNCNNEIADINEIKLNLLLSAKQTLQSMLDKCSIYSEKDWQERIKNIICILFPKYLYCLREVNIGQVDGFDKQPDFILIDSNGCIDLMEIKKPDLTQVMREAKVRNNYVPQKAFIDVAVQTTKYLLTINKNYLLAQKNIMKKLLEEYPETRFAEEDLLLNNPKGIILYGRSNNLDPKQLSDFELIRRQYKDIPEIMTYDDLFERLNNLIQCLS